jgi:hypothetical protein
MAGMPPAPPRLSITTGRPHVSLKPCPIIRPTRSVPLPGADGTTMRTGLLG